MPVIYVAAATYWTVLVAELIGDKCIYTVASLSVRVRRGPLLVAMLCAFGGKMFAAVILGEVVVRLPQRWTSLVSALVFFGVGATLWLKERHRARVEEDIPRTSSRAAATAFAALFLTEWGDPGQIAAAAVVVQSHLSFAAWLGGTLALMTKGIGAMSMGVAMRDRLPERALRAAAVASCCALGVAALFKAL